MNILKMMKGDLTSVVGLRVEYDFGGSEPLIGWIAEARVCAYATLLDGQDYVGKYYVISFTDHPFSFYGVGEDAWELLNDWIRDNNFKWPSKERGVWGGE